MATFLYIPPRTPHTSTVDAAAESVEYAAVMFMDALLGMTTAKDCLSLEARIEHCAATLDAMALAARERAARLGTE